MREDVKIERFDADRHAVALADILLALHSADEPFPALPAGTPPSADSMMEWLRGLSTTDVDWVAKTDDQVRGFVRVTDPHDYLVHHASQIGMSISSRTHGEVVKLFVAPDQQGSGVGRQLLHTALRHIEASGRQPVLAVLDQSQGALGFYSAVGLKEVGAFQGEQGLNHVLSSAGSCRVRTEENE